MPPIEIGTIKMLQIQQSRLKLGEKPNRVYDPSPIMTIKRMLVTSDGAYGITDDHQQIVDVHNKHHFDTRYNPGRTLSIGFTSHYDEMREKYGAHITDGIAGESIIVESTRHYTMADFNGGLVILDPKTEDEIHLNVTGGIAPCVPFSKFSLQRDFESPEEEKATLQFLHDGQRGFLLEPDYGTQQTFLLQTGFKVFITS
ncbi:MAG: hypothetical protein CUN54_09145 [Phototrophicales bacterium]|nr:MAG: hypothetical protein CUN54_09145 [Phototrophicales bacterium]